MHTANGLIAIYRQADLNAALGYEYARSQGFSHLDSRFYGEHCFRRYLLQLLGH